MTFLLSCTAQVKDLGLEPSLLTVSTSHPSAANRFLLHPSLNLLRLPSSPWSLLTTLHKPLTRQLLLSILREPFQPRADLDAMGDESVDAFIRRRFGPYIAEHMLSAVVHGIYAADSRQLSVRSAFPYLWEAERRRGSVVKAMLLGLGPKTALEERKAGEEAEAWEQLGPLAERMRKGVSVWGLEGGLGKLAWKLRDTLKERGVEFLFEHEVTSLKVSDAGVQVSFLAGRAAGF